MLSLLSIALFGTLISAESESTNLIIVESADDGDGIDVSGRFQLVWNQRLLIIGPSAGTTHDHLKTADWLCEKLSLVVNCQCEPLADVRTLNVTCEGVDESSRLRWFADHHNMDIINEQEITSNQAQIEPGNIDGDMAENAYDLAWHADILDAVYDGKVGVEYTGEGVHIFVLDTGFTRLYERTDDFPTGVQLAPDDEHWHPNADEHDAFFDCNGHGTQVAFLAGGKYRAVAPNVIVHIVRISSCPGCVTPAQCGGGTSYSSYTFRAVNWIVDLVKRKNIKKAIVTRSFSTPKPDSSLYRSYTSAAQTLADNDIIWVASAGNDNRSRCVANYCTDLTDCPKQNTAGEDIYDENALIVGALTRTGEKASFSSWGECVSQWIYGDEILGVPPPTNDAYPIASDSPMYSAYTVKGTSFAAPLAAGIAALFLEANENTVKVNNLKQAVNDTMVIQGSAPPSDGFFRVRYDLDASNTLLSESGDNGDGGEDDVDLFYYCAPKGATGNVYFSSCFYKDREQCIRAGSYCSWTVIPATNCEARSVRYFDIYNILCQTIANSCNVFGYICQWKPS